MKHFLTFFFLAFTTAPLVGCIQKRAAPRTDSSSDSSASDPGDNSPSVPAPEVPPSSSLFEEPSLACSSSVIDTGQKGSATTAARGVYSDTKIIPGTSSPATAFVDPSAISIKFSYWNGDIFVTEPVAPDGTGAFVRLVILSNRTPIILWTLGAYLKAAIRSAPLGSSGTWNAGVIDTATAARAVEVAVNPLDQVTVTYLTNSTSAGRPKFLYCGAPCSSPASFQTMTLPYIENTNIVASQVATGAGWCKASNSLYYPVAAYSITGATRYAICRDTLSNCLIPSNWTAQTVVATGNLSSKVFLDPTVIDDVPKVVSLGASGIVPYRMGTTACSATPTAFTAGSALGSSTTGNQWMSVLKDLTGRFHLIANASTTSVAYYNSLGTDILGGWNASGTVDTVTLSTSNGGGAGIGGTSETLYVSYGLNSAPYNLKLAHVNDISIASNSTSFTRFYPDLTGNLQLSAANSQQRNISAASTSIGRPAIAYVDFSVGSVTNAKLKLAYRDGDSSVPWGTTQVPNTLNPQYPFLAFDAANRPWISYFDAGLNRFILVTNSSTDGSGSWSSYEFPLAPSGAPIALPAANNTSLAMVQNGSDTDVLMVVIDNNAASRGVKSALLGAQSRTWTHSSTIDALSTLGATHLSASASSSGIAVAYQDLNAVRVKYAYSASGSSWSSPLIVSGISQGQGSFVRINPVTGTPAISYFDPANNAVYITRCSGSLSACASGGWTPVQVASAVGVSGLAAGNAQLLATSIGYSLNGKSYVFFARGQGNDGNLAVGHDDSGAFQTSVLANGANANLPGAPALNFGVAGWGLAMTTNAAGSFSGAYLGPGNWLYGLSCGD